MCGEYSAASNLAVIFPGSPPRVRGIPCLSGGRTGPVRITPACAGNTSRGSLFMRSPVDHPRVCGEYAPAVVAGAVEVGSPPRVRGILFTELAADRDQRITPACAGNTPTVPGCTASAKDHPRVCGEYLTSVAIHIP